MPLSQKYAMSTLPLTAFLQSGFYRNIAPSALHRHPYAECHFLLSGKTEFLVNGTVYVAEGGTVLLIPRGALHTFCHGEPPAVHRTLQIKSDVSTFTAQSVEEALMSVFQKETALAEETGNHAGAAACVALFLHRLGLSPAVSLEPMEDPASVIRDFFSLRYAEDVHLCDLAQELCRSERQTERLVRQHVGTSFREALTAMRMEIAQKLMADSRLTLHEIAGYVGYQSYTGFWKALKRHIAQNNPSAT